MAHGLKAILGLLGIAAIVGGVVGLTLIDGGSRPGEAQGADTGHGVAPIAGARTTIPPIDAAVPDGLRTATFALG